MLPIDTFEKWRLLNLFNTRIVAHTFFRFTTKSFDRLNMFILIYAFPMQKIAFLPIHYRFGLNWNGNFGRKDQRLRPIHHFSIGFLRSFRTKWRITWKNKWIDLIQISRKFSTNKHFVHNNTQRPPITRLCISVLLKYFWRNIIRSADCGIGL